MQRASRPQNPPPATDAENAVAPPAAPAGASAEPAVPATVPALPAPPLPLWLRSRFRLVFGDCPYNFPQPAVYWQGGFLRLDPDRMGTLLANGFRRNGNYMYAMQCPACRRCVSIRLDPTRFRPNRIQRRVWRKNQDLRVQIGPLAMTPARLALLDKFLRARFRGAEDQARSYYGNFFLTTISSCFEIRYFAGKRLVGVSIVDAAPEWMNAVYFFFDPDFADRSPGVFNILYLTDFCRRNGVERLYLGFCIHDLPAMAYKGAFKPHEILKDGVWREVT